MSSKLVKSRLKWFTLVEVILVCTVFAILVSWIIVAISKAFNFMDNTRLSVRATNFAREWVEMMYNIRDTSRRKCSWKKDAMWLYLGSGNVECNYDSVSSFTWWIYTLNEGMTGDDKFIYAENLDVSTDFYNSDWFFNPTSAEKRDKAKLNFTWTYKYLSWDDVITWEINELLWSWVNYYRIVRVYGIYKKNTINTNESAGVDELEKWSPAEMRFCVKVFYEANWSKHSTELCSIMTNFME